MGSEPQSTSPASPPKGSACGIPPTSTFLLHEHRGALRGTPEMLPHSPSQMPLSCPVALDRPVLIELQATKPPPTPTRAEEDIATTPGCGPVGRRAFAHADTPNTSLGCRSCAFAPSPRCRSELRTSPGCRPRHASRHRTRLLAPKKTSPRAPLLTTPTLAEEHLSVTLGCRPRAPDALLLTPMRAEEHLAVMPGCRPRSPDAKVREICLKNRPWAYARAEGSHFL